MTIEKDYDSLLLRAMTSKNKDKPANDNKFNLYKLNKLTILAVVLLALFISVILSPHVIVTGNNNILVESK